METHQPTAPARAPSAADVAAPTRLRRLRRHLAPTELPWRKPRFELALLLLVALAALSPVVRAGSQDTSRLCLSRAMVAGKLTIEPCANGTIDRSRYGGRTYSDK